ncbi:unnamed protein product [Nezara viridula]|uniref:Neuropeptide n=1 Tax=Nezara viridula TaxID=85310 RepID=A0A9P0MLP5_NEZVI|nr:unnamed protein product [Nezara viridula]
MKHYVTILLFFCVTSGSSKFFNKKQPPKTREPDDVYTLIKCTRTLCCLSELTCGSDYQCLYFGLPVTLMEPCDEGPLF